MTERVSDLSSRFAFSLVSDGEFVDDVQVADHHAELVEGDLAVEVSVRLHNRAIDQLLQLGVVQVGAHHHLQNLEQFSVRDKAVIVDVIDLEGETKLVILGSAG